LHVVKWLHWNRLEGCTTDAMDWAAGEGHLDMLKWLHSNRNEGFTIQAMERAARYGHLKVVMWLYTISKTCSSTAIDNAAEFGHLGVVKFLCKHMRLGNPYRAATLASNNGYHEIVSWLRARRY
jgi:hypothetical protein